MSQEKERKRWSLGTIDDEPISKKNKTHEETNSFSNNTFLFDEQLKQSLLKFRKVSEEEIFKLTNLIGLDFPSAVNTIIDKIRSERDLPFVASKEDIYQVMKLGGFTNEDDAIKALIVREELVNLRKSGLAPSEAIDALINRIKALIGLKRKNNEPRNDNNIENTSSKFEDTYQMDMLCLSSTITDSTKKSRTERDFFAASNENATLDFTNTNNNNVTNNNTTMPPFDNNNNGHLFNNNPPVSQNNEDYSIAMPQSFSNLILEKKRTRGLSQENFDSSPTKKLKPKS